MQQALDYVSDLRSNIALGMTVDGLNGSGALAGLSAVFAGAGLANPGGVAPNFMPCCTIGGQMVCCIVNASMECCKRFMS